MDDGKPPQPELDAVLESGPALSVASDHWLVGQDVARSATPNLGGVIQPEYLVLHYTAGRSAASSIAHFMMPSAQASAHLVIGRDGSICQLVPFNRAAWHAGISTWAGRTGLNGFSIGIEFDNAGRLSRRGERYFAWFGKEYPAAEAIEARHRNETEIAHWHAYTEPQIARGLAVAKVLVSHFGLRDVLGHDDVSPGRKSDPGPAFPMRSFRSYVLGRAADALPRHVVTADLLNVRTGPGASYPLARSPLARGTRIGVVEMQPQWSRVALDDGDNPLGWVRNSYLQLAA